jgi:putative nucleotidyltransferase with HDIG domain
MIPLKTNEKTAPPAELLQRLPALSSAIQQVILSFEDPALDIHVLAERISQDQFLSAKVLRVANSSFYGLRRQVSSISDAVVVLGFGNVRGIALAAGFSGLFPVTDSAFSWPNYWQRCMAAGIYARCLANQIKLDQESAFTAGLFHDIGLAAMAYVMPEHIEQAMDAAGEGDLLAAERTLLGYDHAELGGDIARYWNFPYEIEQAIRQHHHALATGSATPLAWVTHAAHLLSNTQGCDKCIPDSLLAALDLSRPQLKQFLPLWSDVDAASSALFSS